MSTEHAKNVNRHKNGIKARKGDWNPNELLKPFLRALRVSQHNGTETFNTKKIIYITNLVNDRGSKSKLYFSDLTGR